MKNVLQQTFDELTEKNVVLTRIKQLKKTNIESSFQLTRDFLSTLSLNPFSVKLLEQVKEFSHQLFDHGLLSLFWSQFLSKMIENPDHRHLQFYGFAALFHDIGFLKLPNKLLIHPHHLSIHDWEQIYQHPSLSVSIITQDPSRNVPNQVLCMIYQHHEQGDGKGYPLGLKENQIQIGAQLIKLSDAISALSSERSYRNSFSLEQIIQILHTEVEKYDRQTVRTLSQYLGKSLNTSHEINSFKP